MPSFLLSAARRRHGASRSFVPGFLFDQLPCIVESRRLMIVIGRVVIGLFVNRYWSLVNR